MNKHIEQALYQQALEEDASLLNLIKRRPITMLSSHLFSTYILFQEEYLHKR